MTTASVSFAAAAVGPFLVTAPNTAVSWAAGMQQEVTWDVAGTDAAPVNCDAVNILLSVDGGNTFPTMLAEGTPNDGSQLVVLPNTPTSAARIMVAAADNVFFDISNTHFTITSATWGACCFESVCEIRMQGPCGSLGGVYQGFGTICEPNPCESSAVDGAHTNGPHLQLQTTPNPGDGGVVIRCLLAQRAAATLTLLDSSGRLVRRLHQGDLPAGETPVSWDGRDNAGQRLPAGLYFARLQTGGGIAATKIIMTK